MNRPLDKLHDIQFGALLMAERDRIELEIAMLARQLDSLEGNES